MNASDMLQRWVNPQSLQPLKGMITKARIIRSARLLFNQKGFHSTAMAELATFAGISVGQIYRYFPGKSALILAAVESRMIDLLAATQAVVEDVVDGKRSVDWGIAELGQPSSFSSDAGFDFEILAEAHRNRQVADLLADFAELYRQSLAHLALCDDREALTGSSKLTIDAMVASFSVLAHGAKTMSRLEGSLLTGGVVTGAPGWPNDRYVK